MQLNLPNNLASFFVYNRAVGGELFDELTRDVTFSEKRARFVLAQLGF